MPTGTLESREAQHARLAKILWNLPICSDCVGKPSCPANHCAVGRLKRLQPFFRYYHYLCHSYGLEDQNSHQNGISTYDDLFGLIEMLIKNRQQTRKEVLADYMNAGPRPSLLSSNEQTAALQLVVRIACMVDCAAGQYTTVDVENADAQVSWKDETTLSIFLSNRIPPGDHPVFNHPDSRVISEACKDLTAKNIQKRTRLRLRPTDDISRHLILDRQALVLEVFHHTSFLKECLRTTRDQCLEGSGSIIPRQLALEILDSIQKVLFPVADEKSRKILKRLISKSGFDPDCLSFESKSLRRDDEKQTRFSYFGYRLAALAEEIENPRAYGLVEKWLERRSGARYVMLATLMGVFFAVFLGIAALCLSGYQTWIAYQAWQHPISPPT